MISAFLAATAVVNAGAQTAVPTPRPTPTPAPAQKAPELPKWTPVAEGWGAWNELSFRDENGNGRSLWCHWRECGVNAKNGKAKLYSLKTVGYEPIPGEKYAQVTVMTSELTAYAIVVDGKKTTVVREGTKLAASPYFQSHLTATGSKIKVYPPTKMADDGAEARKKAEEAARQKKAAEEAKKKKDAEEARKKQQAEEARKKKADQEAAAKKKDDEEAAAKKKADEEAAAKKPTPVVPVEGEKPGANKPGNTKDKLEEVAGTTPDKAGQVIDGKGPGKGSDPVVVGGDNSGKGAAKPEVQPQKGMKVSPPPPLGVDTAKPEAAKVDDSHKTQDTINILKHMAVWGIMGAVIGFALGPVGWGLALGMAFGGYYGWQVNSTPTSKV